MKRRCFSVFIFSRLLLPAPVPVHGMGHPAVTCHTCLLVIVANKFIQIAHIIYDDALIFQSICSGNAVDRHSKCEFVISLRCRVFVEVAIAFAERGQLPQGQLFRFAMTHENVKLNCRFLGGR